MKDVREVIADFAKKILFFYNKKKVSSTFIVEKKICLYFVDLVSIYHDIVLDHHHFLPILSNEHFFARHSTLRMDK